MNVLTAVVEVTEQNATWFEQLLPFVGVGIGALITGLTTLGISIYNNKNNAERELTSHNRNASEEHRRWLRNEKVRVYNDYLNSAEHIKQVRFSKLTGEKEQLEIVEAFDVLTNPTLLPISSKSVVKASEKLTVAIRDYLEELSRSHPDGEIFGGRVTPEIEDKFKTYRDRVHQVSNAMRADLGIEPIYDTPIKKEALPWIG